jgi:hypothetical protein
LGFPTAAVPLAAAVAERRRLARRGWEASTSTNSEAGHAIREANGKEKEKETEIARAKRPG